VSQNQQCFLHQEIEDMTKHQGGGRAIGFNNWWWDWGSIHALLAIVDKYLSGENIPRVSTIPKKGGVKGIRRTGILIKPLKKKL
jgi:hypothetical protein